MDGIAELVKALRERTWLSPVSAEEMNHRDRWLADQIEQLASAAHQERTEPPTAAREFEVLARFETPEYQQREWEGQPPSVKAIEAARAFFRYAWSVVPCVDGGVQLERHNLGFDMEITFDAEGQCESVYAELAKAAPARAAEWQPISTAPKDFTPVLLCWQPPAAEHIPNHRPKPCVILERWYCRTHAHQSKPHDCPNELDCKMGWGHYAGEMTAWMPLPLPPCALTGNSTTKE